MFAFGKKSLERLNTCKPELQEVAKLALSFGLIDFSVTEGYRTEARQEELFSQGRSKVRWPDSKHNANPSDAFDLTPFVNGKPSWNVAHCCFMAGVVMAAAARLGCHIRWGGNWDRDGEPVTDQTFDDLVHFELVKG